MLPIMGAYWITLAFPFVYIVIWFLNMGDMTPTKRGDFYARVIMYVCLVVVILGALVGVWLSALVPGLYA